VIKPREEPCGRDRRASEIEYLFSVSFPLVGSPQRLAGARILPTVRDHKKDSGQARMTEIRNCGRDQRVYNLSNISDEYDSNDVQ